MNKEYRIESAKDPQRVIQFLEDKIYEHNSSAIQVDDGRLFALVINNENIVAGISGWTWASACEITNLWVDAEERKKGVGKELLAAAEAQARSCGCHTILIRSYSFQAPNFYEKHGFKIEIKIQDFPEGHYYYILTKRLT